jgi:hypothetical protein
MNESKTVTFTPEKRDLLREAYNEAISEGGTKMFLFDGNVYVTKYAGYLLEHLDNTLGKKYGNP